MQQALFPEGIMLARLCIEVDLQKPLVFKFKLKI